VAREHAKTSDCALQKKAILTPEQFLTELSDIDALLEAEQDAIRAHECRSSRGDESLRH
jgi:hypothetical protein